MSSFIEIRGKIIAIDDVAWVEYLSAAEIAELHMTTAEPEGRTYVILKGSRGAQWIAGDVRAEFRTLLAPATYIGTVEQRYSGGGRV